MGKRSDFERVERDFYPTPIEAVMPLVPHLPKTGLFAEPCAGDWESQADHVENHIYFCFTCFSPLSPPNHPQNTPRTPPEHPDQPQTDPPKPPLTLGVVTLVPLLDLT